MDKKIKQPYWFKFNVETYRASTSDLSTVEHGALLLIRLHYWFAGPIRDDDKLLGRIVGLTPSEWRKVRPALVRFFVIDGEWINTAWDHDLEEAFGRIKKASESGRKGNDVRWSGHRDRGEDDPGTHRSSDRTSDGNPIANPIANSIAFGSLTTTTSKPPSQDDEF